MAIFTYTATKDGKTVTGSLDAVSKDALVASLIHQGLRPVVVKEGSAKKSFTQRFKRPKKVKKHDIVVFTRQLSTMISAGVPLTRSLNTLQAQTENKHFKEVVQSITKDVEGGQSLATSFSKFPDVFSDVYIN